MLEWHCKSFFSGRLNHLISPSIFGKILDDLIQSFGRNLRVLSRNHVQLSCFCYVPVASVHRSWCTSCWVLTQAMRLIVKSVVWRSWTSHQIHSMLVWAVKAAKLCSASSYFRDCFSLWDKQSQLSNACISKGDFLHSGSMNLATVLILSHANSKTDQMRFVDLLVNKMLSCMHQHQKAE